MYFHSTRTKDIKNNLVTGGLASVGGTSQQSIMYPLQFWFCRNIGLALPLIALQYHDVKLKFNWGSGAASDKIKAMEAAGFSVASSPSALGEAMSEAISKFK